MKSLHEEESTTVYVTEGESEDTSNGFTIPSQMVRWLEVAICSELVTREYMNTEDLLTVESFDGCQVGQKHRDEDNMWWIDFVGIDPETRNLVIVFEQDTDDPDKYVYFWHDLSQVTLCYLMLINGYIEGAQRDTALDYEDLQHEALHDCITQPIGELVENVQSTHSELMDTARDVRNVAQRAGKLTDDIQGQFDSFRNFVSPPGGETDLWESILSRGEDFLLCVVSLTHAKNISSVICAIMAYAKTFVKGSLTRIIGQHITDLVMLLYNGCRKELKQESVEEAIDFLGMLKDNWKVLVGSKVLENASGIMTAIMAVCFTGSSDAVSRLNIITGGLFKVKFWDFTRGCTGLIDMVLSGAHFFLSKGVAILSGAPFSSLFLEDALVDELDKKYSRLISWTMLIDNNELDAISKHTEGEYKSREAFVNAIMTLKEKYIEIKKKENDNSPARNVLNQRIYKLDSMVSKIMLLQKKETFIKRALTTLIFGGSGVAKTTVRILTYKAVCRGLDIESSSDFLCIPNEKDAYDSEYDPKKHHSMLVDDVCNARWEWYQESPVDRFLRGNNNTPSSVIKAEAEQKGKYQYGLKAMYGTTNVKDVGASVFSNNPASIMRRFDLVVSVKLKKEFTNDEGVFYNPTDQMFPDAWDIIVEKVRVTRSCSNEGEDMFTFVKVLQTDDVWEYAKFIGEAAEQHDVDQSKAYKQAKEMEVLNLCEHFTIRSKCTRCAQEQELKKESEPDVVDTSPSDDFSFSAMWQDYTKKFSSVTDTLKDVMLKIASHRGVQIGMAIGALVVAKKFLTLNDYMAPQSEPCAPVPVSDETENEWSKKKINRVPIPIKRTMKSSSTCSKDLVSCLSKSVMFTSNYYDEKDGAYKKQNNFVMIPLKNDYWLTTSHSLHPGMLKMANVGPETIGIDGLTQKISEEDISRIPGKDIAVVRVRGLPMKRGYLEYFPLEAINTPGLSATSVTRVRRDYMSPRFDRDTILDSLEGVIDENGLLLSTVTMGQLSTCSVAGSKLAGYLYKAQNHTYNGMCGSPYVVNTKGTVLLGVHSGGNGVTGFCHSVTMPELKSCIEQFTNGIDVTFDGGITSPQYDYVFDQPSLNVEGVCEDDVAPKHCLKWLPVEQPCSLEVYGPHDRGSRSLRSNVKISPISESVEEIMEWKREHGPPKGISTWRPWQQNMQDIAQPRNELDPDTLRDASTSYENFLKRKIGKMKVNHMLHVWDLHSVVNGVPGVTGADRVCVSTSAGVGVWGSKLKLAEGYAVVDQYGTIVELRFTPEVERLVNDIIEKAENGERIYTLYQAHIKDEPTKLLKNKLRVFAGTQLAFLLVCKMYLGSLNRVMQMHWDEMECCISANAHSSDWTRLYKSLFTETNKHRCFEGDYVHWDKSMTPQLTLATGNAHKSVLAASGNYSEKQLKVVNALYVEFAYPIYEWDGVYFQAYCSLPSGVFATVMVSNGNNSTLFRYTYMRSAPDSEYWNYDTHMKANFMGDDNLGAVEPECTWWDMHVHRDELAKAGFTYTSADKKSELKKFVNADEAGYLKRKFRWCEDVQQYVAPIEIASIFKPLHCYVKRKDCVDPVEKQCGSAIDSGLREFWRHGREVYSHRVPQLEQIMRKHDLQPYISLCTNNALPTYDEMVTFYLEGEPAMSEPSAEGLMFD